MAPVSRSRRFYGWSKVGAELLLNVDSKPSTIVRTTGLYGTRIKQDFVSYLISRKDNESIKVVKNCVGNQTYTPHLAEAILKLAYITDRPKIGNIASSDILSRYEFALTVAVVFGLDKKRIIPTTNKADVGWLANRPVKGGLRTKLGQKLGLPIYSILDGLYEYGDVNA